MKRKRYRKGEAILVSIIVGILGALIIAGLIFVGKNNRNVEENITWEEYQAMTEVEQMKFIDSFGEGNGFEEWMESVNPSEDYNLPWEKNDAKQVKDYSWEEFNSLDEIQQEIFVDSFNETFTFEEWLDREKPKTEDEMVPWEKKDSKQPDEYTWNDYEALTETQQMMFIDYMDSKDGFEEWLNDNKPNE